MSREGDGNVTFESLNVNGTVVSLSRDVFGSCAKAIITVDGGSVRFRIDGGYPTTTAGHLLASGDKLILETNKEINSFKAINVSVPASIQVTYDEE